MSNLIPFLTWAGGKRWLMHNYSHLLPSQFDRYIEPFLGSGASFFALKPTTAILSDLNPDLINTYNQIKYSHEEIVNRLHVHHRHHSKDYYYQIRGKIFCNELDRAAQFIYLNRTCWNGLYRVNQMGIFNVPIGTKPNVILDTDNFSEVAERLSHAEILCNDFVNISHKAKGGDFIYFDPPYTVKHNNNNFIKYNKKLFSWNDQIRLFEAAKKAKHAGAKVAISNACHESLIKLYENDFNISVLNRYSSISGNISGKKGTEEILATSYVPPNPTEDN